jgi:hypothetical protein
MQIININNQLPKKDDADKNGDVFGYANGEFLPVPFRSIRRNAEGIFTGWRKLNKNDYFRR